MSGQRLDRGFDAYLDLGQGRLLEEQLFEHDCDRARRRFRHRPLSSRTPGFRSVKPVEENNDNSISSSSSSSSNNSNSNNNSNCLSAGEVLCKELQHGAADLRAPKATAGRPFSRLLPVTMFNDFAGWDLGSRKALASSPRTEALASAS